MRLPPRRWSLALKLTLAMTCMIVIAVAGVTYLAIARAQVASHLELEQQA